MRGLALLSSLFALSSAKPGPEGLRAWELYVARTEARIESELEDGSKFLVLDFLEPSERARCEEKLRKREICVLERETLSEEGKPIEAPGVLIHHWYGGIFLPGVNLGPVLDWVRTYEGRDKFYPDVEASRLIDRNGETYHVFLRLKRTKVQTVHYNTEHEVIYQSHGDKRASSRSVATRIRQIDDAGSAKERELPPDDDSGYLYRLQSYWRFEERDSGTYVECESVSLSRDTPQGTDWLVRKIIDSVPRESLENALEPIREHVKPIRTDRPEPKR
ncbi:MAG TPA: hypothetical protein VIE88_07960 [Vicinamibacteria bacterium]|jgi:hypothetical protein